MSISLYIIGVSLIFPYLGFVLSCAHNMLSDSRSTRRIVFVIGVIIVARLNYYKLPVSDLAFYEQNYESSSALDFLEFLKIPGKEELYYSAAYLLNGLGLPFKWFIFLLTALSYFSIARRIPISKFYTLFLALLFLLPEIFLWSGHLVRQFLAYALATNVILSNFSLIARIMLYILLFYVHQSSILFLALDSLIVLISGMNINTLRLILAGTIVFSSYFFTYISLETLLPILHKLGLAEQYSLSYGGVTDSTGINPRDWFIPNLILASSLAIGLFRIFILKSNSKLNNLLILYSLIIFVSYNLGEMAHLMTYRLLTFLPVLFILHLSELGKEYLKKLTTGHFFLVFVLIVLVALRFTRSLLKSDFDYGSFFDIVVFI